VPQQATKLSPAAQAPETSIGAHPSQEEIATLAYSLWQTRGCQHGMADEDWLSAEKDLIAKKEESDRLLAQV
jgi:Protein of unknown function (DUF2934)